MKHQSFEEFSIHFAAYSGGSHSNSRNFIAALREELGPGVHMSILLDVPTLNPAARKECKQILLALISAFKRAFKYLSSDAAFENALAQSNEELGKLVSLGKGSFAGKVSAGLFVTHHDRVFITTAGGVRCWIYRGGKLMDLSSESILKHPLKTFENFSSGKLQVGDAILCTNQAFIDRVAVGKIQHILSETKNPNVTGEHFETLVSDDDLSEFSSGFLLLHILPKDYIQEKNIAVKETTPADYTRPNLSNLMKNGFSKISDFKKPDPNQVKETTRRITISFIKKLREYWFLLIKYLHTLNQKQTTTNRGPVVTSKARSIGHVIQRGRQKYLYIGAFVLALVLGIYSYYAHAKTVEQKRANSFTEQYNKLDEQIKDLPELATQAHTRVVAQLQQEIHALTPKLEKETQEKQNLVTRLQQRVDAADKSLVLQATNLGPIGDSDSFLKFAFEIGAQKGETVNRLSKLSGKFLDKTFTYPGTIEASAYIGGNKLLVYDGEGLVMWDISNSQKLGESAQSVPLPHEYGGFVYSAQNGKVYMINKQTNSITGFEIRDRLILHPGPVVFNEPEVGSGFDLAYDGSFWILSSQKLYKRASTGAYTEFNLQDLYTQFAGRGKVLAIPGQKNVYVLDGGNGRVLVLNRTLTLLQSFTFPELQLIKDFDIDERAGTMYLLSEGKIYKATFEVPQ
ncbi:MAG TPA: hypothetical protein VEA59_00510 [Patescibacteria group bacterium]|nr:hypothetical protein [Patescibacteria group bacterium]